MSQEEFIAVAVSVSIGVIIAIELFFYIRIVEYMASLRKITLKAYKVLSASKISDHWKERIIPYYGMKVMGASLKMGFAFCLLISSFLVIYGLGLFVFGHFSTGFQQLFRFDIQIIMVGLSVIYGVSRKRLCHG